MPKLLNSTVLPILMVAVLAVSAAAAAPLKKFYDPQNVTTIQGQIDRLETITRQGRQAVNNRKTTIAHLKTPQGVAVVHLGPTEFLAQQQFIPCPGDSLEVTGGIVRTRQGQVILATTVTKAGRTYILRDTKGVPVWTGQTPGCFSASPG